MKSVTLNLPDPIAELYPKIGDKVFLSALRESARHLIDEEQKKLKEIRSRIKTYEKKYNTKFHNFQKNLPQDSDYQIHEDYGEWSYLIDVVAAIEIDIANYQKLNGILQ